MLMEAIWLSIQVKLVKLLKSRIPFDIKSARKILCIGTLKYISLVIDDHLKRDYFSLENNFI